MKLHVEEGELSEINVTPLVDVFLVLLVIFMITAPVLKTALEVGLPPADTSVPQLAGGIVVELDAGGSLMVDGRAVAPVDLVATLHQKHARAAGDTSGVPIFLAADKRAPYGDVVAVLDRMRLEGFPDVGLLTDENGTAKQNSRDRKRR